MAENKEGFQKRQTAYKVRIKDLLEGEYIKEEGWQPNYIKTKRGRNVSRINLISVVVQKDEKDNYGSLILDDGSGRISVRSFDQNISLNNLDVGNMISLIGRPREYGSEKYIMPEVIKVLEDTKWAEVRRLELKELEEQGQEEIKERKAAPEAVAEGAVPQGSKEVAKAGANKEEEQTIKEEIVELSDNLGVGEKIFEIIKEMDNGDGADTQEVINKLGTDKAEDTINNLLKEGEIFETKPGKIKVLE